MKSGIQLETDRLILRHWTLNKADRDFFHFISSNKVGRRFYPNRMDRKQAGERLESLVNNDSSSTLKWGVACLKKSGQPVGFTGLSNFSFDVPFAPGVEIGWQYHPEFWGQGYATEGAMALIRHGFEDCGLEKILAFAVLENSASIAVMKRLDMSRIIDGDFDHPQVPNTHPHLKRHLLCQITTEQSQARNGL
jgi:RimJ/RimL family protein N-acetyltransferase